MIIYGTNKFRTFHDSYLFKSKNDYFTCKMGNINIDVKCDYKVFDNYYISKHISCLYLGQPYFLQKKINAKEIVRMYTKKNGFLKNIKGAFLLLLYDSKKDKLIIYRSVLFMDTIYYKVSNKIEFSNILKNITINEANKLSREYINQYLSLPLNSYINVTPYIDVYRIIPGQCVDIFISKKKYKTRYLKKIHYSSKITNMNEEECSIMYYNYFEESVKDLLLNSNKNIKIYASGGLDSSAIIYVIHKLTNNQKIKKEIELIHQKHKNDGLECDFLEELNKKTNYKIIYEEINENSIFRNINLKQHIGVSEPSIELLTSESENNIESYDNITIFSGYGGDQLLYSNLIDESDNKLEKTLSLINSKKIVLNKLNYIGCQHLIDKNINRNYLLKYNIEKKRADKLLIFGHKNPYKTVKFSNYYLLFPYNTNNSFDIKYPFCDERLIEFCFNLNYKYYYNNVTKYIFRKAFNEKLPKSIIERKSKTSTYNTFYLSIKKQEEKIWEIFDNSILVKENIFDKERYRSSIYKFINSEMIDFIGFLNILALDYWLILQYNMGGKIYD